MEKPMRPIVITPASDRENYKKLYAKRRREYLKSLTPEEKLEIKLNREYDKERRKEEKLEKQRLKLLKLNNKREITVLKFMLKNDVLYYHHGEADSMKKEIEKQLTLMKEGKDFQEYHPYIWNYQGEGKNYLSRCKLGCIFSSSEFDEIYDVPLDGTYRFEIYDSGERGLGSFNRITAKKVEEPVKVPYVNPGAIIPITL